MTSKDESNAGDQLADLFGEAVYSYTDRDAIEDGVLLPFLVNGRDTRHRLTTAAYEELKEHYRQKGYADYSEIQFHNFFLAELLPLVPFALRAHDKGGILTTDYDFHVRRFVAGDPKQLWYIPNEVSGITMMRPDDY